MCAEAFSALLKRAEEQGRVHGAKVAKSAPSISHLFFIDDTILFTRATVEEADRVKEIIFQYESTSGQQINLEKTEITVSSNISMAKKQELGARLGVKTVHQHTKYLGLSTVIGKSKKTVFAGLVDRVVKKLKDWKDKMLSQAGKEVLIKVVIQAILSYSMNCFLLPITTCQEIEKATARFFWGATEEERKHHWIGWDVLTRTKAEGGIGFKELYCFNIAMLAKQFWNLMEQPKSLSHRILKEKYFPRTSMLEAGTRYKPSYLWQSLLASKNVVKEGMRWRIGDGKSVNIQQDRWVGVEDVQKPTMAEHIAPCDDRVDTLIDAQTGKWNEELIQQNFHADTAKQILTMPLRNRKPPDLRIWKFTKHGFFSVRTAYHIAVSKISHVHEKRPSCSETPKEWKKIWKINVIPRV